MANKQVGRLAQHGSKWVLPGLAIAIDFNYAEEEQDLWVLMD